MAINVRGMAPLLAVFDMPISIAFYCDVLGFRIVSTSQTGPNFGWALLSLNGVELMLNTAYDADQRPPSSDAARVAAHNDTTIYFGCPDVDGAYAHLRERGIAVKRPRVAHYGMNQLYVIDPDGYNLCFQWPASQQMKDEWRARYGTQDGGAKVT